MDKNLEKAVEDGAKIERSFGAICSYIQSSPEDLHDLPESDIQKYLGFGSSKESKRELRWRSRLHYLGAHWRELQEYLSSYPGSKFIQEKIQHVSKLAKRVLSEQVYKQIYEK